MTRKSRIRFPAGGHGFFFFFSAYFMVSGSHKISCAMDTGCSCHRIEMAGVLKLPKDLDQVRRPKNDGSCINFLIHIHDVMLT